MQFRKVLFPVIILGTCLLLVALGGLVGYQLANRPTNRQVLDDRAWLAPAELDQYVQVMRQVETMAGAFALDRIPLAGVEKCYYESSIDFKQVTWTGRDMPTPFLGFAPQPGPLPGAYINGQQFRYRRDLERLKPEGTYRIFVIGGSTAFGTGASNNETTVAGYLERYLNEHEKKYGCRFEVVTAATSCWASSHERILVENRLVEFQPDVVVSLSGHNDAFWGLLKLNINCYRAIQDAYYLRLTNALLQPNFDESYPYNLPSWHESVSAADSAARLGRNVEQTRASLQSVGADYCFALQPILSCSRKVRTPREERMATRPPALPVAADQSEFVARYDQYRTVLSAVKSPHFHFWDLTALFDDANGSDIFIDRCHFGDRGNDMIAKRLKELLSPVLEARLNSPKR